MICNKGIAANVTYEREVEDRNVTLEATGHLNTSFHQRLETTIKYSGNANIKLHLNEVGLLSESASFSGTSWTCPFPVACGAISILL